MKNSSPPRISAAALRVLKLFLEEPRLPRSGIDIAKEAKVGPGTLYPLLMRLEKAGWLVSEWENVDPQVAGRPKRRFYQITRFGQVSAIKELDPIQVDYGAVAWT